MYCNYSKNRFENEVTFIIPPWLNLKEAQFGTIQNPKQVQFTEWVDLGEREFINHLLNTEYRYFELLRTGWTPQQARAVLPNALKTELIMTGFISDWEYFFKLRDSNKAHPQAQELAEPLYREFINKGYIIINKEVN